MVWKKSVSASLVEVYEFDGTQDIFLYSYNPTSGALVEVNIPNNGIALGKLAQISTARILGRSTAGTGNVESLTAAQVMAMLPDFTGDAGSGGVAGRVPAPAAGDAAADKYLKADGAWATISSALPPGLIADFGMDTPPSGWLLCYGQEVSRSTYSALFAAIGTTWGAGNSSTTFNLPDLRGKARAGLDNMGGSSANRLTGLSGGLNGDTFAASGGAESVALVSGNLPPFTINIPLATGTGSASTNPGRGFLPDGGSKNVSAGGSSTPFNIVQPTAIVLTCIKT